MEFTSVSKIFQEIRESNLSDGDKEFIVAHSWRLLHAAVVECGLVALDFESINSQRSDSVDIAMINALHALKAKEDAIDSKKDDEDVYLKNAIVLTDKPIQADGDQDLKLYLQSDDVNIIEQFKWICTHNLPKEFRVFHKLNHRNLQRFDFWKPVINEIVAIGTMIETVLGIKFLVDVDSNRFPITNPTPNLTLHWMHFDENKHEFEDFDPVIG